ncbi:hypothetical protein D3C71_1694800 [compost metagenome]
MRSHSRLDNRQRHRYEGPEIPAAVNLGRIDQIVRDIALHKLTEEEDRHNPAEQARYDQWKQRIHPTQLGEPDILGDHDHRIRNHHRAQETHKNAFLERKLKFGEGIRRHRRYEQPDSQDQHNYRQAVDEPADQRRLGPDIRIVGQGHRIGNPLGRHIEYMLLGL